jgi:hypothetical protein
MLGDRRGYSHLKEEALIALSGGIDMEEAVDLSSDRLLMLMMILGTTRTFLLMY